jgi:hypothetical protein
MKVFENPNAEFQKILVELMQLLKIVLNAKENQKAEIFEDVR